MISILYASRATARMDAAALTALLTPSCERNLSLQVTGMLLYAHGSFLQQLEGEADAVDAIFTSITRDPRHADLRLLSRTPIRQRRYPDWAMGFEHPDAAALGARLPGYRLTVDFPLVDSELIANAEIAENLLRFAATAQLDHISD